MKKILTFFIAGATIAALGMACNKNGQSGNSTEEGEDQTRAPKSESELIHVTTDYIVVNKIDSDIVVELKAGDGQTTTIKPGESQVFCTEEEYTDPADRFDGVEELREFYLKKFDPEMRINGEVLWPGIWDNRYREVEVQGNFGPPEIYYLAGEHYYRTYTWTITKGALEQLRLEKEFFEANN